MKFFILAGMLFFLISTAAAQNSESISVKNEMKQGDTMFLIRDIFHTKPGKAKELVKKIKQAAPHFEKQGMKNVKIMTDIATTYWTVVIEWEVADLSDFGKEVRGATSQPEVENIMKGYMDLVDGGEREIFMIE
jgi:hypothetical protein